MTTLDDKILGEKLHNYCSSSEDENTDDESGSYTSAGDEKHELQTPDEIEPPNKWSGTATNTGPKGVMEDWKRYKQMERRERLRMEKERIAIAKKSTLTVGTVQEDEQRKKDEELDQELEELLDDEILLKFQRQRMKEIIQQIGERPKFGKITTLKSKNEFLCAVDDEDKRVVVIIHIYSKDVPACTALDGCLSVLAGEYQMVKFCRIAADLTGLSRNFKDEGLPALLVYKGGQIIGNFVKLSAEFGDDFFAPQIERHLMEFGILPIK